MFRRHKTIYLKPRLVVLACLAVFSIFLLIASPSKADNQNPVNNSSLGFVNFLAINATILGVAGGALSLISYIVKLTNVIKDLEKLLIVENNKTRDSFLAELTVTKDFINKINSKFEIALVSAESHQELASKDFVNLQKEVQAILRSFDVRLQNIENLLESKLDYKVRRPKINENIEGL